MILLFHTGSSTTHPSTVCGSLLFHSMLHMFKNFGMRLFQMSHTQLHFMTTQYLLWYVYCFIWHLYLHTSRSSNGPMTGGVTLLHMHIKLSKFFQSLWELHQCCGLSWLCEVGSSWSYTSPQLLWWPYTCCSKSISVYGDHMLSWNYWATDHLSTALHQAHWIAFWTLHAWQQA